MRAELVVMWITQGISKIKVPIWCGHEKLMVVGRQCFDSVQGRVTTNRYTALLYTLGPAVYVKQ